MKKLKMYEIIEIIEDPEKSVLIELIIPYKKSLYTYYKDFFCCEPVLMVTMVCNAVQYARIEPENEFGDALFHWIESSYENAVIKPTEEDKESEKEIISSNSLMLKDL